MKKKILCFILSVCFIIPCAFMLAACDGKETAKFNYEQLSQGVDDAIELVEKGTLTGFSPDESWYEYEGENYKAQPNLTYLIEDDGLLSIMDNWLTNEYAEDKEDTLFNYDDTYIKAYPYYGESNISIYRDTGSSIEVLNVTTYTHSKNSTAYRTDIYYAKCDSSLVFYKIYFENDYELEVTSIYEIDVNYSTLKTILNEDFTVANYNLIKNDTIWVRDYSYSYTFRVESEVYKSYSFDINGKRLSDVWVASGSDESKLSQAENSLKNAFSNIISNLYNSNLL